MRSRTSRPDLLLTADWLTCLSVFRMILKSDGIIPPPPAAPAPQPPAPSNQVEGKNPAICWSSWTDRSVLPDVTQHISPVSVSLTSVVSISVS